MFEQETGIKIKLEEYESPEEMYTKFSAGSISYDVVRTSDYMVERLISEGETEEIDYSKMQYIDNIGDLYWEMSKSYDPELKYSIPYFWGTVGILYNTKVVKEKVDSWMKRLPAGTACLTANMPGRSLCRTVSGMPICVR